MAKRQFRPRVRPLELQADAWRAQPSISETPVPILPAINEVSRREEAAGLPVRRFALSNNTSDSITILQHLDYFKKQYGRMPEVRQASVELISCADDNDVQVQAQTLLDFVRDKMKYVRDPSGSEFVISPVQLLKEIQTNGRTYGDCDDHALLFNAMATSIGIPTRFYGVKLNPFGRYNHVICGVQVKGEWMDIDPCAKTRMPMTYIERLVI